MAGEQTPAADKISNYLTMVGHLCTDINQGALSAVLPFLLVAHPSFNYLSVTMLVFASNIASAVIQPLFGRIGDKHPCPWFMAVGSFLAGFGMFLIGFVESYWLIVCSAMISGMGVAMFHPEGGRLANLSAGERKANGMSIFAVGGQVGFFVGPALTAVFLTAFGMHGTFVFLIPAIASSAVLLLNNKRFKALNTKAKIAKKASDGQENLLGIFSLVLGAVSLRSIASYGMLAFIPLFMMRVLGLPDWASSLTLTAYSIFSAIATALSGRASERFGTVRLMGACFASNAILTVAFAFSGNVVIAILIAVALAFTGSLFHASTIAYGMECMPRSLGTASGLLYGLTVAIGGATSPLMGIAGDAMGLTPVFLLIAGTMVVAFVLSLIIKRVGSRVPRLKKLG